MGAWGARAASSLYPSRLRGSRHTGSIARGGTPSPAFQHKLITLQLCTRLRFSGGVTATIAPMKTSTTDADMIATAALVRSASRPNPGGPRT